MICYVLAMGKQHLGPHVVVGYGIKIFWPGLFITSPDHLDIFDNCFTRDSHTSIGRVYFLTGINKAQNLHACLRCVCTSSLRYELECPWRAYFLRLSDFDKKTVVLTVRGFNYYFDAFDPSVYKICCEMGEENVTTSCPARAFNIDSRECKKEFLKCCLKKHGAKGKKVSDWHYKDILLWTQ